MHKLVGPFLPKMLASLVFFLRPVNLKVHFHAERRSKKTKNRNTHINGKSRPFLIQICTLRVYHPNRSDSQFSQQVYDFQIPIYLNSCLLDTHCVFDVVYFLFSFLPVFGQIQKCDVGLGVYMVTEFFFHDFRQRWSSLLYSVRNAAIGTTCHCFNLRSVSSDTQWKILNFVEKLREGFHV